MPPGVTDSEVISYPDVASFLAAIYLNDTATTNEAVGPLYELWWRGDTDVGDQSLRLGLWRYQKLELIFVKLGSSTSCYIASPRPNHEQSEILHLLPDLINHLQTLPFVMELPGSLRSLFGPTTLASAFVQKWRNSTFSPIPRETFFLYTITGASLSSAAESDIPHGHLISFVRYEALSQSQIEDLVGLGQGFFAHGSISGASDTADEARQKIQWATSAGAVWIYTVPSSNNTPNVTVVAYAYTARPTANTVQIRRLFVSPRYRRTGIVPRMISHISRKHVLSESGIVPAMEAVPPEDMETKWGPKKEVCLLVEPADKDARRVYQGVGFVDRGEFCSLGLVDDSWRWYEV